MQKLITIALLVLTAHSASACAGQVASPGCNVWERQDGVNVCVNDPYTDPEAADACEAVATKVEACPDKRAEPCEAHWTSYDTCMRFAADNPGTVR